MRGVRWKRRFDKTSSGTVYPVTPAQTSKKTKTGLMDVVSYFLNIHQFDRKKSLTVFQLKKEVGDDPNRLEEGKTNTRH